MGDVVRLKPYLKAKKRAAKDAVAAANRAQFGRTKHDKQLAEAERRKAAVELNGKRLDGGEPDER